MKERLAGGALLLLMLAVFPLALAGIGMHASSNPQVFLLLVIDFDDFMCPACMDSVLDFCRALPVPHQQKQIWGIVVSNQANGDRQEGSSERILEKKIRGFVKANNLEFPIVLDRDGVFTLLAGQGTVFFVFDAEKQTVSRYVFPLAPNEISRIQKSLRTNYQD